jgi:hypothetical protein
MMDDCPLYRSLTRAFMSDKAAAIDHSQAIRGISPHLLFKQIFRLWICGAESWGQVRMGAKFEPHVEPKRDRWAGQAKLADDLVVLAPTISEPAKQS